MVAPDLVGDLESSVRDVFRSVLLDRSLPPSTGSRSTTASAAQRSMAYAGPELETEFLAAARPGSPSPRRSPNLRAWRRIGRPRPPRCRRRRPGRRPSTSEPRRSDDRTASGDLVHQPELRRPCRRTRARTSEPAAGVHEEPASVIGDETSSGFPPPAVNTARRSTGRVNRGDRRSRRANLDVRRPRRDLPLRGRERRDRPMVAEARERRPVLSRQELRHLLPLGTPVPAAVVGIRAGPDRDETNGDVVQSASTASMIFPVARLVANSPGHDARAGP